MSEEEAESMEGVEEEEYLVGFPILDGNIREIEINILIWAAIMYPETKFELVCKLWYQLMRLPDFRKGVMGIICVGRPERFPGYMIIPPWLEEKGWRYLYSSKEVVDPGLEDDALMLGTTAYDDFKTMYEGFWCMGNMRSMIGDGGGNYDLLTVPNGQGVMYHKNHDAVMVRNNREVDEGFEIHLREQGDLRVARDLLRNMGADDLMERFRALRGGDEPIQIDPAELRRLFEEAVQGYAERGIAIKDPSYDDLTLRLQILKAKEIEERLRQERRRQYPDGAPDDEAFEARVVEVLDDYFNPQIPSLVIQGCWQQGSLVRGTVHRKGKLLVRLDKYVGMGCWEGEVHFPRPGIRFEGTFRLAAPISYEYRFLDAMCNQSMERLTQTLIGRVISDAEDGRVLDTFPKPHQAEIIRKLEEAKRVQEERDAEQVRINSIQDTEIRKDEREVHKKRLADTVEARRMAKQEAEKHYEFERFRAALVDVHRQLMEIEDPEERAIAFELHRVHMRQAGVPEEMLAPPDEEQNERLAAVNRMRALVGAPPVGHVRNHHHHHRDYNPYAQVAPLHPPPVMMEEGDEGPPPLEDIGPMNLDDEEEDYSSSSSSESKIQKKARPSPAKRVGRSRRKGKKMKKKKGIK